MIFGEVIQRTLSGLGNFIYGHPLEIIQDLTEKAQNGNLREERFPLIALFLDVGETKERFTSSWVVDPFKIVLIQDTKPEYKAAQRTRATFEPVLLPLYDSVISAMSASPLIDWNGSHERFLRYYWGRGTENVFNDFIDAIEINFSGVSVFTDMCNPDLTTEHYDGAITDDPAFLEVTVFKNALGLAGLVKEDFLIVENSTANDINTVVDSGIGSYELTFESAFNAGDYFILKVMSTQGQSDYLTFNI